MEESTSSSVPVVILLPYKGKCEPKCSFCLAEENRRINEVIEVSDDDDVILVEEEPRQSREIRVSERFNFRRIRRLVSNSDSEQ